MAKEPLYPIPDSEPRTLGDYWVLVLVAGAGLLIWAATEAQPGDTATMLGMRQALGCSVAAVLALALFLFLIRRNKRLFGRYFTNKAVPGK